MNGARLRASDHVVQLDQPPPLHDLEDRGSAGMVSSSRCVLSDCSPILAMPAGPEAFPTVCIDLVSGLCDWSEQVHGVQSHQGGWMFPVYLWPAIYSLVSSPGPA